MTTNTNVGIIVFVILKLANVLRRRRRAGFGRQQWWLDFETRARWPANIDLDVNLLIALLLVTDPQSEV